MTGVQTCALPISGMALNPGAIHISGGAAAHYGALAGGVATLAAYAGIKCMRHLWNFIRCSFRAFTFHKKAAGTTTKGPGNSTIHNWDER